MPHQSHAGGGGGAKNLLPEINSMTFLQLFRLGFAFSLPVAVSIFLGAIIICVVIYFAMGAGIS
jgi:hypothetical protein